MKSSTERRSGRRSKTGSEEDVTEGTVPEGDISEVVGKSGFRELRRVFLL